MIQNHRFFSSLFFLYSLSRFITFCSSINPNFLACKNITSCGNQTIKYPFYIKGQQEPFCGYPGFGLSCSNNAFPILKIYNYPYIIHRISYETQTIRVSEVAPSTSPSCAIPRTHNITLEGTRFNFTHNQTELLLFLGCHNVSDNLRKYGIGCSAENETNSVLAMREDEEGGNLLLRSAVEECNDGLVKAKVDWNGTKYGVINGDVLRKGFVLNWVVSDCSVCDKSGGKCGFNADPKVYNFKCYCPDRDHALKCDTDYHTTHNQIPTSSPTTVEGNPKLTSIFNYPPSSKKLETHGALQFPYVCNSKSKLCLGGYKRFWFELKLKIEGPIQT